MVLMKKGLTAADGDSFGADWTWALIRGKLPPVEFGYVDNVAPNQEAGEWGPDGTQTEVITSNRTPLESNEENFETLEGILLLWEVHKDILDVAEALGTVRDDVLLTWSFKTGDTPPHSTRRLMGQLHNSRWTQIGGLQVVDYYGAAEAHAYMTEHMNRYFGFNVIEEPADSPDNWKGDASSKVQYYCDEPTILRATQ